MIGTRQEAQRLSKLAQERYGAYGLRGARVVLTHGGYMLIVGDLTTLYWTAAGCEQMILEFGTPPVTSRDEIAPWK